MRLLATDSLDAYDCLFVSPHAQDAAESCGARLADEAARGRRLLQVTVFDGGDDPRPADALPADHLRLGFTPAPARGPISYCGVLGAPDPRASEALGELSAQLEGIAHRTRARSVFLPLGVGGHVDHRLVHEAGVRALESGGGRDVFLYEDRPYALARGAVRLRLAEIGAWLPPGAVRVPRPAGLLRYVLGQQRSLHARTHLRGAAERLRLLALSTRRWRAARAWRPARALGLRVQPVVFEPTASPGERAPACAATLAALCGCRDDAARAASGYARSLAASARAERYWLLLPHREELTATRAPTFDAA